MCFVSLTKLKLYTCSTRNTYSTKKWIFYSCGSVGDWVLHDIHFVASGQTWYFVMDFSCVPLATLWAGTLSNVKPIGSHNFKKNKNKTLRMTGRYTVYMSLQILRTDPWEQLRGQGLILSYKRTQDTSHRLSWNGNGALTAYSHMLCVL